MVVELDRLCELRSRPFVFLHLEVGASERVMGSDIIRIDGDSLLQSLHRALGIVLSKKTQGSGVRVFGAAGCLKVKF